MGGAAVGAAAAVGCARGRIVAAGELPASGRPSSREESGKVLSALLDEQVPVG